ncbi:MAG: hypothetical protein ACNA7W_01965, partial [Pseudomonadales bacterium]
MSLLPWHEPLADHVRLRITDQRLPHALLVAGPEGWGDRAFANWLALHLLAAPADRDAAALAHPDLRWVAPEGAVIKVDVVRELVAFAQGTPQSGPHKVVVIEDAHYLNRNAANALLKTLEEPPAGTYLLLTSCHPSRLIATIRSRCQPLLIRPDPVLARKWLDVTVAVDDLDQRLFEHGGAPVAVAAGVERGERPIDAALARAIQPQGGSETVTLLLEQGLADTLGRWYRYVLALAAGQWQLEGRSPAGAASQQRPLMEFADELTWARRMLVSSNSAN